MMDFDKVLSLRRSTRTFSNKQVKEKDIKTILCAANRAPVGSNQYKDLHITIVQDQKLLLKLCEAAWVRFSDKEQLKKIAVESIEDKIPKKNPNLFYDAPVVFIVSHRRQTLQPGIEWANAASVVNQMHLAATNLGLGSCYMWGSLESMRMFPELDNTHLLQLPEYFEPLCGLAVGYPTTDPEDRPYVQRITMNKL